MGPYNPLHAPEDLHVRITVSPWRFLTHLPLDKMAAVLADNIFKCMFLNENFYILIKIPLKFVPKGPIDNNPALV